MEKEDWNIDCSDDELKDCKGPWEPKPEEINRLYTLLDNEEYQELQWKCPGYRSPSPEVQDEPEQENDDKGFVFTFLLSCNSCELMFF